MVANRLAFLPSSEGISVETTRWLSREVLTYSMSFRFDFAIVVSKATRVFSSPCTAACEADTSAFATRPGLGRCRAEALSRSRAGFHCIDLAVAWRSVGDERIDQLACRARDPVDRPVECNLVGL